MKLLKNLCPRPKTLSGVTKKTARVLCGNRGPAPTFALARLAGAGAAARAVRLQLRWAAHPGGVVTLAGGDNTLPGHGAQHEGTHVCLCGGCWRYGRGSSAPGGSAGRRPGRWVASGRGLCRSGFDHQSIEGRLWHKGMRPIGASTARPTPLGPRERAAARRGPSPPPPTQTPAEQEPMLQSVPSALGGALPHAPVAGSHEAGSWHSPFWAQSTPTHRSAFCLWGGDGVFCAGGSRRTGLSRLGISIGDGFESAWPLPACGPACDPRAFLDLSV
jgi:hypothetical protein